MSSKTARILPALWALVCFGMAASGAGAQEAAEPRFVAAQGELAGGDVQVALEILDDLIRDYPASRYPDGEWRAAARVRAGEIELSLGRTEDAVARFVRVIDSESPSSWTSRARLGLASSLLWDRQWPAAAKLLQQVVEAFERNDVSADPVAGPLAADRLTLLHRVWLRTAAGEQPWQRSGRFEVGIALDRPIGIAASPNGLLISDEGADALVFRDSTGNAATFALREGQRPWWSERGDGYVAVRAGVSAPLSGSSSTFNYSAGGRQRALEDIRAGVRTPTGEWVLLDDDAGVMMFGAAGEFIRALDSRDGEPIDVERGPRGRLFVIEGDRREVMVFDDAGSLQGGFAIDGWREPYALAVDAIGHVYVLDRDNKTIDVFDPDGGILWSLGPVLPGGVELDDPRDIAVDGSGRILVADRGLRVLVVIE